MLKIKFRILTGVIPLLLIGLFGNAQNKVLPSGFIAPLDLPHNLSGSFGELRGAHFHSGVDFNTGGAEGRKIYAVADGYVSRIRISPRGYGKAIYITHPNGKVSVYGHLKKYNESIAAFVKKMQYQLKSFELDTILDSTRIKVKRGQLVAYSGNSGRSSGPHLHFEIRDAYTEKTINPLLFGYKIMDKTPPIIEQLVIYPFGPQSTVNGKTEALFREVVQKNNRYVFKDTSAIRVTGDCFIGVLAHDKVTNLRFKNGLHALQIYADSNLFFAMQLDSFSFNESPAVNSFTDYEYFLNTKKRMMRTYVQPNNPLNIYKKVVDKGILKFNGSHKREINIQAKDFFGNVSNISFSIFHKAKENRNDSSKTNSGKMFYFDRENFFAAPDFLLYMPENVLYDTLLFNYQTLPPLSKYYSNIHVVHHDKIPTHIKYCISIKPDSIPQHLLSKVFIAKINGKNQILNYGGKWSDGYLMTHVEGFGKFVVLADTVKPKIVPINIKDNMQVNAGDSLRLKITDDLSGIKSYNAYINNKWVLMEFDEKKNMLILEIDEHINPGKNVLKIIVEDAVNNRSEYKVTIVF